MSNISDEKKDVVVALYETETTSSHVLTSGGEASLGLPLLSVHRRHLHRIASDGVQNIRHHVPESSIRAFKEPRAILQGYRDTVKGRTRSEWIETFVPAYKWLKIYSWKSTLLQDVIAGCTVGSMVVPQSMSYAKLAGLPVEFGLYSALIPVYAYALFGSSRQLAVGPVAIISLLLNTGLTNVLPPMDTLGEEEYMCQYQVLAIQVSFLTGLIYIGMGLLRLGFVTIFLSHAVVSGFTTGASVIIGMSQLKYIFGYPIENANTIYEILQNLLKNIDQFNWRTFLMGTLSIFALVLLKHVGKTFPRFKWIRAVGPLTVTGIALLVTWAFSLDDRGIPVVGSIPKGFPTFSANVWTPISNIGAVMQVVIGITIVGFMESIAIGKQLASKHKYQLDSSLELMGLGMANFLGSMFQSYPVSGSFSRSAVNHESGAKSGISGIVTASLVALVLLFLTPVFELLPFCVLAAIVISGVLGLLDYEEAIYLWKVHRFDFSVWLIACLGTLFLGVEIGLAIAVGVSLLLVIYESAYPHTAVLGRLPGTTVYRNVKQYPEAERYEGVVMVRIDAPIYFANTQNVRERIEKYHAVAEAELEERGNAHGVQYIILELGPVSHVDSSALHILNDMLHSYQEQGIQLCLANPSPEVMERFLRSGFAKEVGRDYIFVAIQDALNWCLTQLDESSHKEVASSSDASDYLQDVDDVTDLEGQDMNNESLSDGSRLS